MQRGAIVTVKVTGKYDRQSPLIQRDLEVPCEINVRISGGMVNHALLQYCETTKTYNSQVKRYQANVHSH